jgi:tyramine---L-glutamate ligase
MSQASWRVLVFEFLSAGGLVEQGVDELLPQGIAMRDAVAADLLRSGDCDVTVATFDGAPSPPAGALVVAPQRGEDGVEFVARLARRHDAVWVIAPESGGLLAAFERGVDGKARWLGCDAAAIALASSKAATVERLHARAIATPLHEAFAAASRWVVKPDDGAGAVATRVHAGQAAALADLRGRNGAAWAKPWVEPWVEGDALSLSLLCGMGGIELLAVNRQHIALDGNGVVRYEGVSIDVLARTDARWRTLATLADRIADALPGLRGFVGVDLVWHDALGPVAIEVNPRLTCAYVGLSQRLSRNLAAEVMREHAFA